MKIVATFTFVFAVMTSALIGCLMIFEIFSVGEGFELLWKALSAVLLVGASSALISFVTAEKHSGGERQQGDLF